MKTTLHWYFVFFLITFSWATHAQDMNWLVPLSENVTSFRIHQLDSANLVVSLKRDTQLVFILNDQVFTPTGFDTIINNGGSMSLARKKGLWGLFDIEANHFVVPPVYDEIQVIIDDEVYWARKFGLWAVINQKNEKIRDYSRNKGFKFYRNIIKLNNGTFLLQLSSEWISLPSLPDSILDLNSFMQVGSHFWSQDLKKEKWFVLDAHGKVVDTLDYGGDFIRFDEGKVVLESNKNDVILLDLNGKFVRKQHKKWYREDVKVDHFGAYSIVGNRLLDTNGVEISLPGTGSIAAISKDFISQTKGAYFDLYSVPERKVVYKNVSPHVWYNLLFVQNRWGKYGLIDLQDGSLIYPMEWTLSKLSPYVHLLKNDDGFGNVKSILINYEGKEVEINDVTQTRSWKRFFVKVKKTDGSTIYYDHNLDTISDERFDFMATSIIVGDFLICKKHDKYGILDKNLNTILPFVFDKMGRFVDRKLFQFGVENKLGLFRVVDNKIDTLLLPMYDSIGMMKRPTSALGGTFLLKLNGQFGLTKWVDGKLERLTPFKYDAIRYLYWGALIVEKDKKLGLIHLGKNEINLIIPVGYDDISLVSYSKKDLKFPKYLKERSIIEDKRFRVVKNGNIGMYHFSDKQLLSFVPPEYEDIEYLGINNFQVQKGNRYGVIRENGKRIEKIIPIEYDNVKMLHPEVFRLQQGIKAGYVRLK